MWIVMISKSKFVAKLVSFSAAALGHAGLKLWMESSDRLMYKENVDESEAVKRLVFFWGGKQGRLKFELMPLLARLKQTRALETDNNRSDFFAVPP